MKNILFWYWIISMVLVFAWTFFWMPVFARRKKIETSTAVVVFSIVLITAPIMLPIILVNAYRDVRRGDFSWSIFR